MSTTTGAVTIQGTVLEVEHKSGEFDGRPYNFYLAHVLVGTKVVEVRFNPDNGDAGRPAEGAQIDLIVDLPKGTRPVAKRYAETRAVKAV